MLLEDRRHPQFRGGPTGVEIGSQRPARGAAESGKENSVSLRRFVLNTNEIYIQVIGNFYMCSD